MNNIDATKLLEQMRHMKIVATDTASDSLDKVGKGNFSEMFKNAINEVNELQSNAGDLKAKFELGDSNVSLADVMIASQKSGVAFQATVHVRNKLIDAYKEIMNMSV